MLAVPSRMIIRAENYVVASASENTDYWGGELFPGWASIRTLMYFPGQKVGHGPEPHYHDCDEFWMFVTGRGHLWLNGKEYEFTPGTVAYNPMGAVHEFHSYTEVETVAVTTPMERKKRPVHIHVDEDGPPEPTVQPFVVPGSENTGPFKDRGTRCPLSELRVVSYGKGESLKEEVISKNEYWLALNGRVELTVDGHRVELAGDSQYGDIALLRKGTSRSITALRPTKMALARDA
jgi:mannose-6-phosphate isomerase-like protein (cupin superfamily)